MMESSGSQIMRMLDLAFADAGMSAEEIDYINAHGTGTRLNDETETAVIEQVFRNDVLINSTQSLIVHTLGASGAIETLVTALSIHRKTTHVCRNLDPPMKDLNFVTRVDSYPIRTGMLEYIPGIGLWLQGLIQGGPEVGPGTLSNFYAIHTAILPASLLILMPFHFWRIRKAGGLVVSREPEQNKGERSRSVPAIPNLLLREMVVALMLFAAILLFSMLFNAPLGNKANPGLSPNPTKAPWYFMGIQEMLLHFHPVFALFVIPALMLIALLALPYIDYQMNTAGVWFASTKGRSMAFVAALTALIGTPLGIVADEYLIEVAARLPAIPTWVTNGLVPFALLLAAGGAFYVFMQRKYAASNTEAVQMVFVLVVAAFLVLTVTGIWFRGTGMKLAWPWNMGTPGA